MSDKDEPGGFVFNQAIPGTNQTTDATASFQPNEYSPKEFGDLERYLRDKRGWSQERLCTILNRRFDPGWNRIKALVTLEAMELGEETSLWVVGLVFGTLLDVAPDALDDFHAAIASTALPAADDDQPTPDQLDHKELRELVEWINLDNLEPHDRKALLHMMMERAERCEAFQPTTATPEETAPKAPITSERQVEQREESGNMGFTLNTSRSGMDESETPQDEATIQDEGTEQPAESTQSTEAERPFSRPILVNAVLNGVDLSDAILRGADMRGAQLQGANLKGADLSYADLSSADLAGANLRGANLTHANLKGADLRSAIMREALIEGANLEKAKI